MPALLIHLTNLLVIARVFDGCISPADTDTSHHSGQRCYRRDSLKLHLNLRASVHSNFILVSSEWKLTLIVVNRHMIYSLGISKHSIRLTTGALDSQGN